MPKLTPRSGPAGAAGSTRRARLAGAFVDQPEGAEVPVDSSAQPAPADPARGTAALDGAAGVPGAVESPEPPNLEVVVTDQSTARVIAAIGEIDTLTAPVLRDALLAAVEESPLTVVDLSGVEFLGSSGLAVLVEARGLTQRTENRLRLVCDVRMVLRALEATGLRSLFDVFADLPGALRD